MNRRKLVMHLLYPHPALLLLLCAASAVLLAYSFIALEPASATSIAAYVLSFLALTLACLRIPALIRFVQRLSLYGAFAFNAVYALFQLCLGLGHHSAWFYAMAGYYLLLAVMRLTLVRHTHHHAAG